MPIRNRLALTFIVIVALILLASSLAIYFFSADYREEEFYSRLKNKANTVAGLLIEVEQVDAELLKIIAAKDAGTLPDEKIMIFNYENEVLYSTDTAGFLIIDEELIDKVRLDYEVRLKQTGHEIVGVLYTDKYDRFVVFAGAVDKFGLSKLTNLRTILFMVFGISMVIVFIAGRIYSARALEPIARLIKGTSAIDYSNLNKRLDEGNGVDEIAQLAQAFNDMLHRLEAAFKMQRNFVANASHELRTPLTAITGQLEVVLMKARSDEEYKEALESVLEDIKSLNLTSNRLLLLAQASSATTETSFTEVRIDDVLWKAHAELIKRKPNYTIDISFSELPDDDSTITVLGNDNLLKTMMLNLLENGCKFSQDETVHVHLDTQGHEVIITVSDNGRGISEEDLPNIFEPFYRSHNAITVKGHGIGLSLVERIVKLHKGHITVESQLGQGTTFNIRLKNLNR